MATLTPMMQQYMTLKEKHKDCIIFFRLGDFYEMFFEDAKLASQELELTLTGRDCGMKERAPMCGVPYHSANTYITRLIEKGYKVAICEQLTDPAQSKGLVERGIIRIITPGTIIDASVLQERENSFLLSICFAGDAAGLAVADVSTGEFSVYQISPYRDSLSDEIARIHPREIITNDRVTLMEAVSTDISTSEYPQSFYQPSRAQETLLNHFHLQNLMALGLGDEHKAAICAAGALMSYLNDTQKNALEHITDLKLYQSQKTMLLDKNTRRNLELTEGLRSRSKRGSLLWLLDQTSTAMGGRLLRTWIEQPLIDREEIQQRLDAVEALVGQHVLTMTLSDELKGVYDIERLLSKVAYKSVNARDCLALGNSLSKVPGIMQMLMTAQNDMLRSVLNLLDPLTDLAELLEKAIDPDAPLPITEGGIIRQGYNAALDEYRLAATNGKQWILDLEAQERQETGIKNLRIQYNRVFGYYIEVTKSNYDLVPLRYQRKQTLANSERYITPELREIEQKIIGAQEQSVRLEMQLFAHIREKISEQISRMQRTALGLKTLDALVSLAKVAVSNHYVKPQITDDGSLNIVEGRHPVVEQTLREAAFVPNDTLMNNEGQRMIIITGPNMAGKSTYMRQVALITLMAHIGSFVPARQASIPIVDRIFTRVGASDDVASGQSTFMVEMSETAHILRNATPRSLIILDEIGRGTSTFDGLSIAWAVVEYLTDKEKCGAKTLFATHYHELSELEGRLEGVENYCISVKEHGEDVIFLRKIIRGGADKSFGIHVARLAGVPQPVLVRAHEIQARLQVSNINQNAISQNILEEGPKRPDEQMGLFNYAQTELIEELQRIDVMSLTPMDAINQLFLLREKARKL
ncbi:MAG: DNA mismatch repair protein MutS [Clostridia bacterium]|nr:DNA mismatch repair protein MutS [Clostridia bacterium]